MGFDDSTAVNILSGEDLAFLYAPDTEGIDNGSLNSVTWSDDGQRLYAGGQFDDGSGISPIVRWENTGRGSRAMLPASTSTIMDLRALSKGGLVFGAADPMLGVLDSDGDKLLSRPPDTVDFRGRRTELSHNGAVVAFNFDTLLPDNRWAYHTARLHVDEGVLRFNPLALGSEIEQIQRGLVKQGYDPGPADGIAGSTHRGRHQSLSTRPWPDRRWPTHPQPQTPTRGGPSTISPHNGLTHQRLA